MSVEFTTIGTTGPLISWRTRIWTLVKNLPLEKAPRPDGFTCHFYRYAWSVIKQDIVAVINSLNVALHGEGGLTSLNGAFITLLVKKD